MLMWPDLRCSVTTAFSLTYAKLEDRSDSSSDFVSHLRRSEDLGKSLVAHALLERNREVALPGPCSLAGRFPDVSRVCPMEFLRSIETWAVACCFYGPLAP